MSNRHSEESRWLSGEANLPAVKGRESACSVHYTWGFFSRPNVLLLNDAVAGSASVRVIQSETQWSEESPN